VKILSNLQTFFSNQPSLTLDSNKYYRSRMALINTNSFIIILKNRLSVNFALKYRSKLADKHLLFLKFNTVIKKKNLLRKFLFSNKIMFFITFKINNLVRGITKLA